MTPLALKRSSTAEQAADALRSKILHGELPPGAPLQEVTLAAAAGISRNTMREALRFLVHEGLVRHSPHRGVTVTALTAADITDIYIVRRMLELSAVEAGRSASPSQLALLRDAVERLHANVKAGEVADVVAIDMLFHQRLVGLHGSPRIDQFFSNVIGELRLGLIFVDRARKEYSRLVAQHRELCDLIAGRKLAKAKAVLAEHLRESEDHVRKAMVDHS